MQPEHRGMPRLTLSATGAQAVAAQCMRYDAAALQFLFTWQLAKKVTGTDAITVTVSYPHTTTTTTSETINITSQS